MLFSFGLPVPPLSPVEDAGGPILFMMFGMGWGVLFWIVAGLVEASIMGWGLKVRFKQALGISLLANLISSAVGLVLVIGATWLNLWQESVVIVMWFWLGIVSVGVETPVWRLSLRSQQVRLGEVIAFCALANVVGYIVIIGVIWLIGGLLGMSIG